MKSKKPTLNQKMKSFHAGLDKFLIDTECTIPLYSNLSWHVCVFNKKTEDFLRVLLPHSVESLEDDSAAALTSYTPDHIFLVFKTETPSLNTVVHECMHLALIKSEEFGGIISEELQEPGCYLMAYMVELTAQKLGMDFISKKQKKKKQ